MLRSMNQYEGKPAHHTAGPDACIHIRNGNFYLDASLYEQYFPQLNSVILLKRDRAILLLPVTNAGAGGLLLKIRNARGDRVIHGQEFCRVNGIDEHFAQMVSASWDEKSAGLMIQIPSSAYLEEKAHV